MSRWAGLTGQPKEEVLVQQAKQLLAEELELIGSVGVEIWEEVNCMFMQQGMSPPAAAQFFVRQAVEASQDATCQSNAFHTLKVRDLCSHYSRMLQILCKSDISLIHKQLPMRCLAVSGKFGPESLLPECS